MHRLPIRLSTLQSLSLNKPIHRIKFAPRGENTFREYEPEEFQVIAGHPYVEELMFADETTYRRILKQCEAASRNGGITAEMKWLGAYYADAIRDHSVADVSIRWIDEALGYGIFAEHDIAAGDYIGEY